MPRKKIPSATNTITCTCKFKNLWAFKHETFCRLWNSNDYRDGSKDWNPDKQCLEDYWDIESMPESANSFADNDEPEDYEPEGLACVCSPPKKWFCNLCKVRREETWLPWEKDTVKNSSNFVAKDRHQMSELKFPNGVSVYGSSINRSGDIKPDFGVYLATGWAPTCLGFTINWTDFGLPVISDEQVIHAAKEAYSLAEQGWKVEVGCVGGHGRTGTFLALLAVLAGVPGNEAVAYVRDNYCNHAVETEKQEWYVLKFEAMVKGLPIPEQKPLVVKNSKGTMELTIVNGTLVSQKELNFNE